mmetsp:Transcript_30710/g.73681  ORF Transcript_30710/g.73681 Transcript_30710/m.73681 type:complete len:96 (+) Transcript_30710:308-595(+)
MRRPTTFELEKVKGFQPEAKSRSKGKNWSQLAHTMHFFLSFIQAGTATGNQCDPDERIAILVSVATMRRRQHEKRLTFFHQTVANERGKASNQWY